jgi:phosphatidylinositol-bisphosphatase
MESKLARIFIENDQIGPVLEKDQMAIEKAKGGILQKYTEAAINFAPSYHFDVGTDRYDTSEKQRVPSWCDRIIWRDGDKVKPEGYEYIPQAKCSDHKPVAFLAIAAIEVIDREIFEKIFSETLKKLDIFENETIPDTEVDSNLINALNVPYFQVSSSAFNLRNKGKVPAQFRFVPPGGDGGPPHPNWIRLAPDHGILMPGQAIQITVFFIHDNEVARKSLKPDQFMESILVMHVEGGRDHFVSEQAAYSLNFIL